MIHCLFLVGSAAFVCCLPAIMTGFDDLVECAKIIAVWLANAVSAVVQGLVYGLGLITGCVARTLLLRRRRPAARVLDSVELLEIESEKWTTIRMSGGDPVWHEMHGWIPAASVCGCGYITECRAWCGTGHETGLCPGHGATEYVDLRGIDTTGNIGIVPVGRALDVIRSTGMTVDAWTETVKRAMREAGGAL